MNPLMTAGWKACAAENARLKAEVEQLKKAADKTYNGWTNYETWCVSLWVDNDEPTYNAKLEMTKRHLEALVEAREDPDHHSHVVDEAAAKRYAVAEMAKEWVEVMSLEKLQGPCSFVHDLLTSALHEVDWHSIADHWIEEVAQ